MLRICDFSLRVFFGFGRFFLLMAFFRVYTFKHLMFSHVFFFKVGPYLEDGPPVTCKWLGSSFIRDDWPVGRGMTPGLVDLHHLLSGMILQVPVAISRGPLPQL